MSFWSTPDRRATVLAALALGAAGALAAVPLGALPAGAQGSVPTQTVLTSSIDPSMAGGPSPTFTATVSESDGGEVGTPTGTVTFFVQKKSGGFMTHICTNGGQSAKRLVDGVASCATRLFGTQSPLTVTVVYGGDATFAPSTSDPLTQTVLPGASVTTVTATPTQPRGGKSVRLEAVVAGSPRVIATIRTGTVTFSVVGADQSVVDCAGGDQLSVNKGGRVTCHVGPHELTAAGSPYAVTAAYSGDANFQASTGGLSLTVSP